jgi:hypothetical protein
MGSHRKNSRMNLESLIEYIKSIPYLGAMVIILGIVSATLIYFGNMAGAVNSIQDLLANESQSRSVNGLERTESDWARTRPDSPVIDGSPNGASGSEVAPTIVPQAPPVGGQPFPFTFGMTNGQLDIRDADLFCDIVAIRGAESGRVEGMTVPYDNRIAQIEPGAAVTLTCPGVGVVGGTSAIDTATVAVDMEFAIAGRLGRYFIRREFEFHVDRMDVPSWAPSFSEDGPTPSRTRQLSGPTLSRSMADLVAPRGTVVFRRIPTP